MLKQWVSLYETATAIAMKLLGVLSPQEWANGSYFSVTSEKTVKDSRADHAEHQPLIQLGSKL